MRLRRSPLAPRSPLFCPRGRAGAGRLAGQVLAYLLAQKVLAPSKWFLLRGNHEMRAVNGDEETYQLGSFLTQVLRPGPLGRASGAVQAQVWGRAGQACLGVLQ